VRVACALEALSVASPKPAESIGAQINRRRSTYRAIVQNVQAAAKDAGIKVVPVETQTPLEIENGFAVIARANADAVMVGVTPFMIQQYSQIAELAAKYRLPISRGVRRYFELAIPQSLLLRADEVIQ